MVSFISVLLTLSVVAGGLTVPLEVEFSSLESRQEYTLSSTGTQDGYYYSFWTDGIGDVTYGNEQVENIG
jgi:endo-1,4-beta-xylanase